MRKVGPLSVLKFSLLFYLCLMLIVLFAMVIVYGVLAAAGAIDSLETVLGYVFGTGTTSTGARSRSRSTVDRSSCGGSSAAWPSSRCGR